MRVLIAILILSAFAFGQHLFYGTKRPHQTAHVYAYQCGFGPESFPLSAEDRSPFTRYFIFVPYRCHWAFIEVRDKAQGRGGRIVSPLLPEKYETNF